MNAIIKDQEKKLRKVPFITTITQKVYSKKNTGKGTSNKGNNGFTVLLTYYKYFFPLTLCKLIRVFILGSQWTS